MELNTVAEMREILDAIEQGKTIQCYHECYDEWFNAANKVHPNFSDCKYRIKPEEPKKKKWRRFLDTAEVFAHNNGSDVLWVKNKKSGWCRMVTSYDDCKFSFDTGYELTMEELFDDYTFKDGTPCGVEEDA